MKDLRVSWPFLPLVLIFLGACASNSIKSDLTDAPTTDADRIKAMAGCYKVGFNFAETFPLEKGYQTTKPYQTGGTEVVIVDYESPTEIHLQHILDIKHGEKGMALKHWRQEWVWEPQEILDFKGNNTWEKRELSSDQSRGRWLQRVTQVDDSPRYECAAAWADMGAGPAWECKSWNPLPRREYTKRSDYQVLERNNAQKLLKNGWVHEQDSCKIKLVNGEAKAFVAERGENTYTRIAPENCATASNWWAEHSANWKTIRAQWAAIRAENPKLVLNFKDPEGDLWQKLFAIDEKAKTEKWDEARLAQESKAAIQSYVK